MTRWLGLMALLPAASGAAETPAPDAATLARRMEALSASWSSGALTVYEVAATTVMWLAAAALCFAAGGWAADLMSRRRIDRAALRWLLAALLVAACGFAVRFLWTEPNIFTDGGSGYGRVMRYIEGYGGLAVLVKLLPAEWDSLMWRAMVVPRVFASLAPAFVVWIAHGLGLRLSTGVLAGIMLAAVPFHAALSASDMLEGAMSSVQLAGVALVLAARQRERPEVFAAGGLLVAWSMWFRPEGALGMLPLFAAALTLPPTFLRRRSVLIIAATLAVLIVVRGIALSSSPSVVVGGSGSLSNIAWGAILSSMVLAPLWLWLPAPMAVLFCRPGRFLVMLAGVIAAAVPVYLRGLYPDPANTHLEALRYGLPAFPWLALMSASAIDGAVARLLQRVGASSPLARGAAVAALLLLVASPVWLQREYLARRYGHANSEVAIRRLLEKVPAGCAVAVPDDHAEGVNIEIHQRYANIAAEAYAQGHVPAIDIHPASDLLEEGLAAGRCWTFLRGPYCYHAYAGVTAEVCRRVDERFLLEPIAAYSIEFRHHRLVTGPDVRQSPWYMQEMPIVLYRVAGDVMADNR